MSIYIILLAAIALMVILIRKKVPIGPAILAGGLLIWLALDRRPASLWAAFKSMVTMPRSYDLLFALYFVVCLEIEMRKSGILNGLVQYLHHLIPSKKVTLAVMPAFLGMLPSIGGARFSAPIVKTVAEGQDISNESKALINFWFRHIMEFANPIVPGILLTCAIANVSVSSLIVHMLWVSAAMFIIGWFFFVAPLKIVEPTKEPSDEMLAKYRIDFILALLPIFGVFALSMAFGLAASVSLLIIVGLLYPVLRLLKRDVSLKEIFVGAVEKKLLRDVVMILYFIQLLDASGALNQIVASFHASVLPLPLILAFISFLIGMLTGMSQGHVAMMMPIVAAVAHGSLDLIGLVLVFGVGGQMVTPTHVCLMISLDYFKADFFKTLKKCICAEAVLLIVFSVVSYLTWAG